MPLEADPAGHRIRPAALVDLVLPCIDLDAVIRRKELDQRLRPNRYVRPGVDRGRRSKLPEELSSPGRQRVGAGIYIDGQKPVDRRDRVDPVVPVRVRPDREEFAVVLRLEPATEGSHRRGPCNRRSHCETRTGLLDNAERNRWPRHAYFAMPPNHPVKRSRLRDHELRTVLDHRFRGRKHFDDLEQPLVVVVVRPRKRYPVPHVLLREGCR